MEGPIVLLTDFGLADPYVGQLKGRIATLAEDMPVIDLTHEVTPYDVAQAGYLLGASHTHFPAGSIFLCVVDPGVGSQRRFLLAEAEQKTFLAPDNGLLDLTLAGLQESDASVRVFDVTPEPPKDGTPNVFHGRDLFAPIASRVAMGASPLQLGRELPDFAITWPDWAMPTREENTLTARVLHVDRFGNCVLGWPVGHPTARSVQLNNSPLNVVDHYAALGTEAGLVNGSQGYYELAANQASAAHHLNLAPGHLVTFELG